MTARVQHCLTLLPSCSIIQQKQHCLAKVWLSHHYNFINPEMAQFKIPTLGTHAIQLLGCKPHTVNPGFSQFELSSRWYLCAQKSPYVLHHLSYGQEHLFKSMSKQRLLGPRAGHISQHSSWYLLELMGG